MAFTNTTKSAVYSCTALVGTNKTGDLKPDEDGYYTMVVGALNAFNSNGAQYPLGPAKALFDSSSSLIRRVNGGNCKAETGHPKPLPGQSVAQFMQRVMTIEETNVCAHFKEIWLEHEGVMDANGRPIVAIMAKVKPSGPMGPSLKESLDNKHENVCFSIRSITNDVMSPGGFLQKNLKNIIGFDLVTEPGLSACTKYNSPSLESFMDDTELTPEHLDSMEAFTTLSGVSLEAADISDIRNELGWSKGISRSIKGSRPASANW